MNIVIRVSGIIGYLTGYGYNYENIDYMYVLLLWPNFKCNNCVAEKDISFFGKGDIIEYINNL